MWSCKNWTHLLLFLFHKKNIINCLSTVILDGKYVVCIVWTVADHGGGLKKTRSHQYKTKSIRNKSKSIKKIKINLWKSATRRTKHWDKTKPKTKHTICKKRAREKKTLKLKHHIKFMCSNTGPERADIIIKWLLWCVVVGCVHRSFIVIFFASSLQRVLRLFYFMFNVICSKETLEKRNQKNWVSQCNTHTHTHTIYNPKCVYVRISSQQRQSISKETKVWRKKRKTTQQQQYSKTICAIDKIDDICTAVWSQRKMRFECHKWAK